MSHENRNISDACILCRREIVINTSDVGEIQKDDTTIGKVCEDCTEQLELRAKTMKCEVKT